MRYSLGAAALLVATASTQSAIDCTEDGGNWYCDLVEAITYTGVGGDGSYNRVSNMDPNSGSCESSPFGYSGSLSPLNEPVSWHFRGPITLKQFAAYTPGSSTNSTKKARRSAHARRHAHHAARRHGHHAHAKRAVGDIVTATINDQVVSWTNEYAGPAASTPAPAPEDTSTPGPAYSATESTAPSSDVPPGCWDRNGYFNADTQESSGITFLNHFGGTGSGTFDYSFGASLSYASSDGCTGVDSPQTLQCTTLPSSAEVVIMTDRQCADDSCGYYRPGTVAYEGFDGAEKAFFFEFEMPDSGETTENIYDPVNIPTIT